MLSVLLLLYILIAIKIVDSFTKFIFNDINEKIKLKLPLREKNIIKQIDGFYGLIGPNINMNSDIDSLYQLFTSDGIIQGVFFKNGELTFVKHLIKTEKILYEERNGKIPTKNFFLTIFLLILNKIKMFPNVMGMANTAILNVDNNNYALFERDLPYLLDINFNENIINTIKKVKISAFEHFSGHSKMTSNGNIETLDYKIVNNIVSYYVLNPNFNIVDSFDFKFKYVPIVHDFYSNDDNIILIDSPLMYKLNNILTQKIPINLVHNKNTFIYIYDKKTKKYEEYVYENGFYIFHYADVKDNKDTIEIYASLYEDLDFTNINIMGKYRMIEINKKTRKVTIKKNDAIEKYNLDFPSVYQDKIISRHFENRRIKGFVITKNLNIHKELFFKNKNICGEHNIIYIKKVPYLLFFNIEKNNYTKIDRNLLSLVNLHNYNTIDIELNYSLSLGFHSIFINNSFLK